MSPGSWLFRFDKFCLHKHPGYRYAFFLVHSFSQNVLVGGFLEASRYKQVVEEFCRVIEVERYKHKTNALNATIVEKFWII